jgi:hypothetical protein
MPRSVLLHPRDTADPASNIIRRADDRTAIINPTGAEPVGFFLFPAMFEPRIGAAMGSLHFGQ